MSMGGNLGAYSQTFQMAEQARGIESWEVILIMTIM